MSQTRRGGHRPPTLMNVYVYTYIFDVMKIVCSNLHAMRAIVCVGHERANTVPLQNSGNFVIFIQFISITMFVPLLGGRLMNAPTSCNFYLTKCTNKCTILEEPRFGALK